MSLDLVVFDMAGTTIDDGDAVNRCLREALARAGLAFTRDEVNTVMGLPKPVAIRTLIDERGSPVEVDDVFRDFTARMTALYETDPAIAEFPGVSRLFTALRRAGMKVALDTGFPRPIARTLIDRLGWDRAGLLDATITSDEVARGRPHPDMIEALMARLGVADARRVAKVGDTPSDLEQGTRAGCRLVIGVTWGTHTREELRGSPHTHLVDGLPELAALLGVSSPSEPRA